MADFGVTDTGFTIKGLDVILSESRDRARQMFGPVFGGAVDLTPTSTLNMILQVVAAEDAELWKRMEDLYYGNFVSTATGDALDLLGRDLGVSRQLLYSEGQAIFTLTNPAQGRQYTLPEGTIVVTGAPVHTFATTAPLTLSAGTPQATVTVRALERGPTSDIAATTLVGIDPIFQQFELSLGGTTTVQVSNPKPFSGGLTAESDAEYRARMLGVPREMWTLESVRRAALGVAGVLDVLLFDPLGGVDVSQSFFNLFNFNDRLFSSERHLGDPYYFDIVVAHEVGRPWRTVGPVMGIFEQVSAAVDRVRPIGIYPNIIQANHIEVGVRATVIAASGQDTQALLASIKARLAADIGALKLGGNVLYSQVMRAFVEQPGVNDAQNVHLRRCPAAFGRIAFGAVPFQTDIIELPVGDNLILGPTEIAIFRLDSELLDLGVELR